MESQYLMFIETNDTGKTKVWKVLSKSRGDILGFIKWYGAWRQYTFQPERHTIWNKQCLFDITKFIEIEMDKRKKLV